MPSSNVIQFSTSSLANSIKKGNAILGISSVEYGPTSTTGFWNGITPPSGGYTIYVSRSAPGPNIYTPSSNNELITYSSKIANIPFTSTSGALAWFATQSNSIVVNKNYPDIVTDGLSLLLDASFTPSYPTTNSVWYDLSGNNYNGSLINFSYFNSSIGLLNTTSLTNITESIGNNNEFSLSITTKLKQAFDTLEVITQPISSSYSQSVQPNIKFNNFVFTFEKVGNSLNQKTYLNSNLILNTSNTNSSYNLDFPLNIKILTNSIIGTSSISEIKTYNKILSQVEVNQNYYQAPIVTDGLVFAVDAGNLVSYESSSLTTYSLTGSNSGSLTNGTSYSNINGGVFVFDGTNDIISVNNPQLLNPGTGSMTVESWFRTNQNATYNGLIEARGTSLYGFLFIADYPSAGRLSLFVNDNVTPAQNIYSTTNNPITSSVWNHAVATLNKTTNQIIFYVNGTQAGSPHTLTETGSIDPGSGYVYWVGGDKGGAEMNGVIAISRQYNRVLSAAEVAQNFNAQRQRFGI